MHILFIAPRLPVPPDTGGKIRTLNILKQLAKRAEVHLICFAFEQDDQTRAGVLKRDGIEVTLISARKWSVTDKMFQVLFRSVPVSAAKYYSQDMETALIELNETNRFDAVHFDHAHTAHYQTCFPDIPCVLDEHNVEYKILERCAGVEKSLIKKWVFKNQARKMKAFESAYIKKFSAFLAVSGDDKELLVELGADPAKGHVIANGVDTEYFTTQDTRNATQDTRHTTQEEAVVFTGSMDWLPNDDAAVHFCKDILPLIWEKNPEIKFYIVGKGPSRQLLEMAQADQRIIVTGRVDDVRDYVKRSKVFVVPLRIGGGTRLKILEAMSMRKAVVSTRIGAEGINYKNMQDIIIADQPREFADHVLNLMYDVQSSMDLSQAGRVLVEREYDWNIIGTNLVKIYAQ